MRNTSRFAIATALSLVATSAAFAESWDVIPGERDPNPVAQRLSTPLLQSNSVYDARMQVLNGIRRTPTLTPALAPFEKSYFDRASQTWDGVQ
jgi:hypothetical protein